MCDRSPEVHHPGSEETLDSIDDLVAHRNPERRRQSEDRLVVVPVHEVEEGVTRARVGRQDLAQVCEGIAADPRERDAHMGLAHAIHVPGSIFHVSALTQIGVEPPPGPMRSMI